MAATDARNFRVGIDDAWEDPEIDAPLLELSKQRIDRGKPRVLQLAKHVARGKDLRQSRAQVAIDGQPPIVQEPQFFEAEVSRAQLPFDCAVRRLRISLNPSPDRM